MGIILLLALLTRIDHDPILHDSVDVIEINHCYSDKGEKRFTQAIFWRWQNSYPNGRYVVVDWRMLREDKKPYPRKDYEKNCYYLTWWDQNFWRRVKSISFKETWTQHDPEVENRKVHPVERRRGLYRKRG